jgi:hypothetical protein
MSLDLVTVTFDCADPLRVAGFWSTVLDRPVDPESTEFFAQIGDDGAGGPGWFFIKVPEGKVAKNRMHVDMKADDREKEIARLVELGATRGADHDEYGHSWTVMADPEGNEFCIAGP